jgi:hypothetical protein
MHVKEIMTDDAKRGAAELRLNVLRIRLYTSLIMEYFHKEWRSSNKV